MSDLYRAEIQYPLDEVQNDVLYYLYQPIIGSDALSLYMLLYIEAKRMSKYLLPASLSRVTSYLSTNVIELEKQLKFLEGIGLLKTYVKYDNDITQYLYQLQTPLSLNMFFKNQILMTLLESSLSQDDFERTVQYFKVLLEKKDSYDEVTGSFQDVFDVHIHDSKHQTLSLKNDFKNKSFKNVEHHYDKDLLFEALSQYQVNRSLLKEDDLNFIMQLGTVYSLDAMTYASLIKEAMKSNGLDQQTLSTNIKKYIDIQNVTLEEIHYKQPTQFKTQESNSNPLVRHMQYLDSLTPYELLKEKQGGKEPIMNDLKIVETLMSQLGLKPSVVNVLIEYVLGKNDHKLVKGFCESIGSTLARKNVQTAMEAYEVLMEDTKTEKTVMNREVSQKVEVEDNLDELLKDLEEGNL